MNCSRQLLLLLAWAAVLPAVAQAAAGAQTGPGSSSRQGAEARAPAVSNGDSDLPSVIVVPQGHQPDERLGNGCWVRFYTDKAYRGRTLTLVGPVQMPKIHVPGGLWVDWSSAIVGPKATVTLYDLEQFKNNSGVLRAGQRVSDLRDKKLGLFEDIHSVKIECKADTAGLGSQEETAVKHHYSILLMAPFLPFGCDVDPARGPRPETTVVPPPLAYTASEAVAASDLLSLPAYDQMTKRNTADEKS
jgi:hypothetical protein